MLFSDSYRINSPRLFFNGWCRFLYGIDFGLFLTVVTAGFLVWAGHTSQIPRFLSLEYDHSIGNVYNYVKWLLISLILAYMWLLSSQRVYAALSVIYAAVFFDDAFELHERVNAVLAQGMGISAHYAGVLLLASLALAAGTLAWLAWAGSDSKSRSDAKILISLTAMLILFGGMLDTLQSEIGKSSFFYSYGIGTLEDGLELVLASLILTSSVYFLRRANDPGFTSST